MKRRWGSNCWAHAQLYLLIFQNLFVKFQITMSFTGNSRQLASAPDQLPVNGFPGLIFQRHELKSSMFTALYTNIALTKM